MDHIITRCSIFEMRLNLISERLNMPLPGHHPEDSTASLRKPKKNFVDDDEDRSVTITFFNKSSIKEPLKTFEILPEDSELRKLMNSSEVKINRDMFYFQKTLEYIRNGCKYFVVDKNFEHELQHWDIHQFYDT